MKIIYRIIFILQLCLGTSLAHASAHGEELRAVTSFNGMKGESVFQIFRDSEGIIWVGTNKGLCRYNGNSIHNVPTVDDETSGKVNDIVQLQSGELVVAMKSGLYLLDKRKMLLERIYADIERPNSLCVLGDTLIVGNHEGVRICEKAIQNATNNETKIILIANSVISKDNIVYDIEADDNGKLWLCTNKQIVALDLQTSELSKYDADKNLLTGNLRKTCLIGHKLYIATYNSGLLHFDTKSKEFGRCGAIDANVIADVRSSFGASDSNLYVATDGKGAMVLDTRTDSVVRLVNTKNNPHLPNDAVYTFVHDAHSDTDWFGFYLNGFSHTLRNNHTFGVYQHRGLDSSTLQTRSFCINGSDIAIGTRDGLWFVSEATGNVRYFGAETIGGSIVTNIKYFKGKYVIANFERGLSVLDPNTLTVHRLTSNKTLESGNFCKLCISPDSSRLFAISNMGMLELDENLQMIRHYDSRNSELPDSYLTDILFDSTGKAWISSLECMSIFDPNSGTIQSNGFQKGYFNNEPNLRFCACHDGDIIAIGENKVYKSRVDMSAFAELDIYDRLNVGIIAFIYPDNDTYWVGTDKGLFLFDKDFQTYRHYNHTDNLPALHFNKQEYQRTPDGRIWFATTQGLLYTKQPTVETPKNKEDNDYHVILDRLIINGKKDMESLFSSEHGGEIPLGWNFESESIELLPLLSDYGHTQCRLFEWAIDDNQYTTIANGEGLLQTGNLTIGNHTLYIRLAGNPKTTTQWTLAVRPSWMFYLEILLFASAIALIIRTIQSYKRRMRLKQSIKTKHKLDVIYAASQAVERHKQAVAEEKMQKLYSRSRLNDEECDRIYTQLCQYMEETQAYHDPNLRASDIAQALGCPPAKLSQLLNQYAKQSFFEFVNAYRVKEFKRLISEAQHQNYTVTAIAEMCGFKRSSFFSAFKQFEGCTPTEYLKRVRDEKM